MGANDLNMGVDVERARYERQNRLNPPAYQPGQDPNADVRTLFGTPTGTPTGAFNTATFQQEQKPVDTTGMQPNVDSSVFNNSLQANGQSANGQLNLQPQAPVKDETEQIFDFMVKTFKAIGTGLKVLLDSGSPALVTPLFWNRLFLYWGAVGLGYIGLGLITLIVGWGRAVTFLQAGFITGALSSVLFMSTLTKGRNYRSPYTSENNTAQTYQEQPVSDLDTTNFGDSSESYDFSNITAQDDDFGGVSEVADDEDEDDFAAYGDSSDDDFDWGTASAGAEDGMNTEDAINTLQEVPRGMYQRQYLYDAFTKVLPTMIPDFATLRTIDATSDSFYDWEEVLHEAAGVTGCKEDNLPELNSVKENIFMIIISCTRPQGFKSELVATEMANIYAYRSDLPKKQRERVYGKADSVGCECVIYIFNGKTNMISLKDAMLKVQDYVLNTKYYMPVIFGVDQEGEIIYTDMKELESIVVTGMPRMGKSWIVQCILAQMCAFVPPTELNIYMCDPKDGISDYKGFSLPHVKRFVSEDAKVLATLRYLVKQEAPRRRKIIGDQHSVNIWDFKEIYPDIHMPIIYVVIDEIVTFASRMDKETSVEFRMLLRELISQLPALGIRAILIPHILNNDIIEKKTSDIIMCKISVCGDADHIEKATGSKPRDFKFKLPNKGDMAVRMTTVRANTMFVHSVVLTDSNVQNNKIFSYMRRYWSKLEPDEVANSVAVEAADCEENEKILKEMNTSISAEDMDLFESSDNTSRTPADDFITSMFGD